MGTASATRWSTAPSSQREGRPDGRRVGTVLPRVGNPYHLLNPRRGSRASPSSRTSSTASRCTRKSTRSPAWRGESIMICRVRPATLSTSSCTVRPSMTSLNLAMPASSVRIEKVYGSRLEQHSCPLRPSAVLHRAWCCMHCSVGPVPAGLDHDAAGAVHHDHVAGSASAPAYAF